jgi:small GTP-binding protein
MACIRAENIELLPLNSSSPIDSFVISYVRTSCPWYVDPIIHPKNDSKSHPVHQTMRNIIIFGEAGSGKSSLVNMIVGKDVAKVSNSAEGVTFKNDAYPANIDGSPFTIYDTAGLNEGDQGRVPHWKAVREIYTLIRQLDGVSLLIYCMRGRVKENARANWTLFHKVLCREKVPIVAVVTGLETYDDPDDWWRDKANQKVFKKNGMVPNDVACVVSFAGNRKEHARVYDDSQKKVRKLIMEYCRRDPWSQEKDKWLANIYQEIYSTTLCFGPQSRLDFSEKMRLMINDFVEQTGMKEEDSKKLEVTLLKAETRLRKGTFRRK